MTTDATIEILKARIRQLEADAQELRAVEDELRVSQERFRALIDTIPYGILEYTADGVITYGNRALYRMCRCNQGELIGRNIREVLVAAAGEPMFPGIVREHLSSHPRIAKIRTADGQLIDVEVAWDVKRDARSRLTGMIAVITDIRARLSAERAIKESEKRYRTLFEKAGEAIFLVAADGPEAGRILDANQAAAAMHGYTVDELKAMNIRDIDGPQAAAQVDERLARILGNEWIYEEILHRRKDGTLFDVGLSAGLIVFGDKKVVMGINRDITERKEAEQRLRNSEMRYRAIFEGSGEGILLADAETSEFRFANPAICEFLGYSEAELTRMRIADIHPPEAFEHIQSEFKALVRGRINMSTQVPCRRKTGEIVFADIRGSHLDIDGRHLVVGFFADVTEQLGIKEAISEQVRFLQTLIDTLPHPIFYKDTEGRYMGCNRAFEQFVGVDRKVLIGKTVRDIEPPEIAEGILEADRKIYSTQESMIYEGSLRSMDGTIRSVVFNKAVFLRKDGTIGGLVGGLMDITPLKRAEQEKALLATAIQQTPEMVIMTDLTGRIHYVNPAFERITGYSRDEAIGNTPAILQSGNHDSQFYQNVWSTLRGRAIWKGRMTNRRKDGTLFEVEATLVPVQRDDGQITDYLAVERDISHEILQERQLRQAQKMEAIGTLAGGIAHDFNNILSAIIGFTEITLHDLAPEARSRAYLEKVLAAGERARALVNQILAFSRSTEQEARPIEARVIIKEAMKLLQATLPSTISIHQRIESSAAIVADPTQIHQVIMNLCMNAAHAMQENGGDLTVSLRHGALDGETHRRHPHLAPGNYLILSVSDTGCGISPAILDRIFDPFFTTKKQGEGTGMGLSVVHGIVKRCGGSIHVQSQVAQGSTFEILLPAIEKEQPPVQPDDTPLLVGTEHILFVDDEVFQVELAEQILQRLGYRVTALNNSREALARFCENPNGFDLVITDMTMPGLTGDELARQILAVRPDTPVIVCTGYSEKLNDTVARSIGIAGIAYKPLIMKEVAGLIRQALARAVN